MVASDARGARPASGALARAIVFAEGERARFVRELAQFVRFESVSGEPARRARVAACAAWLADHLRAIGLERVRVATTPGHPIVLAEWVRAPPRPTLIVYGHYDVQPSRPDAAWSTPPFGARIEASALLGRGASDDKGQMWAHVKAIESFLRTAGTLPLRVKCVFDGEEEVGSPNLMRFLAARERLFAADAAIVSDMPMLAADRPALTESLRGVLAMEIVVKGAPADLHSGLYGGAVANPLLVLCALVASLVATDGRVAVDGFYDRVRPLSPRERAYMARIGPSDQNVLQAAGVAARDGEREFTAYESTSIRPALNVTGIVGGHAGPGAKAIIPARARATLDFRLVPDQQPREIARAVARHIAALTPPNVRVRTRVLMTADPVTTPRSGPAVEAAIAAMRAAFGVAPVFVRIGGTIPVVHVLQRRRIPTVLMGLALPDDRMHAPNERLHLPNLYRGIAASLHFMATLAAGYAAPQRLVA
jgi:acetylornithine deacetylase/succinyl-diaminopimelate desuccinylase-like protein